MSGPRPAGRGALLVALLLGLWLPGARRAAAQPEAPRCGAAYAEAFAALHEAASVLRLRAESAEGEVGRLFGARPERCEPGAYARYLGELLRFSRRALRSGATPQSPKEGWVRAAQAAARLAPRTVPQAEYYEDLAAYEGARGELAALITEAGPGAPSALREALGEAAPRPGAYGPLPALLPPAEPPPEVEPAPSALVPGAPAAGAGAAAPPAEARAGPEGGLADGYLARASALFRAERFADSAEELRKAYLLRPRPLYLFNMAQAYRRAARPREALALYREFLDKDPQSALRAEARGYAADMESLLAEQERGERTRRALTLEQGRVEVAQQGLAAERLRAERAERERRRPVYRRGWFWGVVTAGVLVAAGVGVGVGLRPKDPPTEGGIVTLSFP